MVQYINNEVIILGILFKKKENQVNKQATTQLNQQQNSYDAKFDILKFILSFLVVAIHTQLFPSVLYPWLRIAVPTFFMITSYFIFGKLKSISDDASRTVIIKKFVIRNLKLYLFWFVLLLPLTLYLRRDIYFANGILVGLWNFVKNLMFGSTFIASWYIMASVIGVLLIFILSKRIGNKLLLAITSVIYILIALKSSYYSLFEQNAVISTIVNIYNTFFGDPVLSFPASLFWITCGKCFAEETFKPKKSICIIMCLSSCVLLYGEWLFVKGLSGSLDNDCYLLLPPVCVGLFGWILTCKPIHSRFSIYFRRCSTVMYALHATLAPVILVLYRRLFNIDFALLNFVTVSVICLVVYAFIEIILKHKTHNKVLGLLKYSY